MREPNLGNLLLVFAPLSLMSVGGGQAVLADMQTLVVGNGWLTQKEFLDSYAIARLAPGPNSLLVTLIGWKMTGWIGALIASIAIFLPSSLLIYSFINVWTRFRGAAWQTAVERGLGPIAAGLILASSLVLLKEAEGGWLAWCLAASTCALALWTTISPLWLIMGNAALFAGIWKLLY